MANVDGLTEQEAFYRAELMRRSIERRSDVVGTAIHSITPVVAEG